MRVGADELADLIDQEDEPVLRPLGVQVLLDPLAEVLDRQGEVVLGPVDPLFGGGLALAERFAERLDDLIPVELVGVPLLDPIQAGVLLVGVRGTPASLPFDSRYRSMWAMCGWSPL